jgi:alpha-L-rhamnosidase
MIEIRKYRKPDGYATRYWGIEYESIRSRIVSDWQVAEGDFRLGLAVPANTGATVSLPITGDVLEHGNPAAQAEGVKFLRTEGGRGVFEVAAGNYRLHSPLQW